MWNLQFSLKKFWQPCGCGQVFFVLKRLQTISLILINGESNFSNLIAQWFKDPFCITLHSFHRVLLLSGSLAVRTFLYSYILINKSYSRQTKVWRKKSLTFSSNVKLVKLFFTSNYFRFTVVQFPYTLELTGDEVMFDETSDRIAPAVLWCLFSKNLYEPCINVRRLKNASAEKRVYVSSKFFYFLMQLFLTFSYLQLILSCLIYEFLLDKVLGFQILYIVCSRKGDADKIPRWIKYHADKIPRRIKHHAG